MSLEPGPGRGTWWGAKYAKTEEAGLQVPGVNPTELAGDSSDSGPPGPSPEGSTPCLSEELAPAQPAPPGTSGSGGRPARSGCLTGWGPREGLQWGVGLLLGSCDHGACRGQLQPQWTAGL